MNRKTRPHFVALIALIGMSLSPLIHAATAAFPAGSPEALVQVASDEMTKVLATGKGSFEQDPEPLYAAVDAKLGELVDYDAIAKSVMHTYFSQASATQQQKFAETFRKSLVRTYTRAMLQFANDRIEVLPPREPNDGKKARVQMQVTSGGKVYPLDYSMVNANGAWRVRNLVVNGVNLGMTYRNQFAAEMEAAKKAGKNMDQVIDGWSSAPVAVPSAPATAPAAP